MAFKIVTSLWLVFANAAFYDRQVVANVADIGMVVVAALLQFEIVKVFDKFLAVEDLLDTVK